MGCEINPCPEYIPYNSGYQKGVKDGKADPPVELLEALEGYCVNFEANEMNNNALSRSWYELFSSVLESAPYHQVVCPECGGDGVQEILKAVPDLKKRYQPCPHCKDGKVWEVKG